MMQREIKFRAFKNNSFIFSENYGLTQFFNRLMEFDKAQQWIVKRKLFLEDYQYRHIILIKNGNYYMSNGEMGEYCEISKDKALKMINRPLVG